MVFEAIRRNARHPYFPQNAVIIDYVPNEYSVSRLLGTFFVACAAIIAFTLAVVSYVQPNMRKTEKATVFWFVLCGCIHFFFEGHFALNHQRMGPSQSLFGQLWKEYALSDSRYLTSDPFVLCMETTTAVLWGPMSFWLAWLVASSHPARHPVQIIVSLGQLYGDVLYYSTSLFDHYYKGVTYSRPEAFYYWGYYVLMNAFWIVIPLALLWDSCKSLTYSVKQLERIGQAGKINGLANGSHSAKAKKHM